MPGQCYSCGTEFGVFKKEHGCKNCGYAFCSKCLHSKTIPVPKKNNAKHHVCINCFKILTGVLTKEETETQYELPQAYIKRMEALKEREKHHSHSKHTGVEGQEIPAHLRHLSKPDREIAARLERLKESNKPKENVTNADISARLANLQGQPHKPEQKPVYQPPDRRLQGQQVDDLLDEIAAEIEIDKQTDPTKDIQSRLDHLRHGDQNKGTGKEPDENNLNKDTGPSNQGKDELYKKNIREGSSSDIDMEEIQRLIEKTVLETELDAQKALSGIQKDRELMERLKEVQKRKQDKQDNEAACGGAASDKLELENSSDNNDSDEDEDEAARKIIQRYLEESKINANVTANSSDDEGTTRGKGKKPGKEKPGSPPNIKPLSKKDLTGNEKDDDDEYDDKDELPYCSICTEDAVIRCRDCDMDLYCQRCFRECHKDMDINDHRTSPYKAPKGYH